MPIAITKLPGLYSQVDNRLAGANLSVLPYRILLIGQKTNAGTAAADTPVRVGSPQEAATLFGAGSMLALMAAASFASAPVIETWALPLADNGAGVAAVGSITLTGTATGAGAINAYIGGQRVQVAVAAGNTAAALATALAAAAGAVTSLPSAAAVDGSVNTKVNFTARNKGELGNTIDIRLNYGGETLPPGISATIVNSTGGSGNPVLTTAIAALGDSWFQVWAMPYLDSTTLAAIEAELASRFDTPREIPGHAFACTTGAVNTMVGVGAARNSPHVTIVASYLEPMPAFCKAAETAAIAAFYAEQDPGYPIHTRPYTYCLPGDQTQRMTRADRTALLNNGIATTVVDRGGVMRTERLRTTYQTNALGAPDSSYLDVEPLFTLMYLRYDWRNYMSAKYAVAKLGADGRRYASNQIVLTPNLAKAEAVNRGRLWESIALIEEMDAASVTVVRNALDPNRIDMVLMPDLINQLRVLATTFAFRI